MWARFLLSLGYTDCCLELSLFSDVKKFIDAHDYQSALTLLEENQPGIREYREHNYLQAMALIGCGDFVTARHKLLQLGMMVARDDFDSLVLVLNLVNAAGGLEETSIILRVMLSCSGNHTFNLASVIKALALVYELHDPDLEVELLELSEIKNQFEQEVSYQMLRAASFSKLLEKLNSLSGSSLDGDLLKINERRLFVLNEAMSAISFCLKKEPENQEVLSLARVMMGSYWANGLEGSDKEAPSPMPRVHSALAHEVLAICRKGSVTEKQKVTLDFLKYADDGSQKQFAPFSSLLVSDDPDFILKRNREYAESIGLNYRSAVRQRGLFDPTKKIVIGYFSADFGDHPVSHLLVDLLKQHDRDRFKVIGFALRDHPPGFYRNLVEENCDEYVTCTDLSNSQIAELCKKLGVAVAIDLNGYTQGYRPNLFGYLDQSITINYLGYPSTSGSHAYDYIIGDSVVTPVGCDGYFDERIIRMDRSFMCNSPSRRASEIRQRSELGLPSDNFIFCNFNAQSKVNIEALLSWKRILEGCLDAYLWLPDNGATKRSEYEEIFEGTAPRLIWASFAADHREHLARLGCADLMLDNFPYGAHATAADAILQGLPVLSHVGRSFQSRVSYSLMTNAGISNLGAKSWDDFQTKAINFYDEYSSNKRNRLRQKLLMDSAPKHPCNVVSYCSEFEQKLMDLLR